MQSNSSHHSLKDLPAIYTDSKWQDDFMHFRDQSRMKGIQVQQELSQMQHSIFWRVWSKMNQVICYQNEIAQLYRQLADLHKEAGDTGKSADLSREAVHHIKKLT